MMHSPFPKYRIETERPLDVVMLRSLFGLTEGLIGRGYRTAVGSVSPLLAGKTGRAVFDDGSRFLFPLGDAYWNRLAARRFLYEPEIAWVLERARDVDYTFIDAGANYGFWSVLASGPAFGGKRAIAIEAAADTFAVLEQNRAANANRFEVLQRAIFDADDQTLRFSSDHHTARRITETGGDQSVTTITLDTVAERLGVDLAKPVILKLDVEGAETAALAGASRMLQADTLVIYEEHGGDATHELTRSILARGDLRVAAISDAGEVSMIKCGDDVDTIKRSPFKGYNFIAVKQQSLFAPLLQLAGSSR